MLTQKIAPKQKNDKHFTIQQPIMKELFKEWCKETKRNGSVLVVGSVYEFFEWVESKKYQIVDMKTEEQLG